MKCLDCNDNGYVVLAYSRKKCDSCDGTGEMDPDMNSELGKPLPSSHNFYDAIPVAIWPDDTEPLYELGVYLDDIDDDSD